MGQLSKFATPMPLVYAHGDNLSIVSELDLSNKDSLIGIKLDRFTLSLTQDLVSWYNAYCLMKQTATI